MYGWRGSIGSSCLCQSNPKAPDDTIMYAAHIQNCALVRGETADRQGI